jgi:microcystin degradation protein MlrC
VISARAAWDAAAVLVVKAAIAYRVAYEPIAARLIEVNTPGLTCVDPVVFTYSRARRPLWGLSEPGSDSGAVTGSRL